MINKEILITEYDYVLPPERIAVFPLNNRDSSKLLVYKNGNCYDSIFSTIYEHLPSSSTLVLNNTRVIEARILFEKLTGGVIEIFCLEPFIPSETTANLSSYNSVQWLCLIGGASKWKTGQILEKHLVINEKKVKVAASYIDKANDSFILEFSWSSNHSFAEILHAAGSIPLPPYIKRKPNTDDSYRYQTIFAITEGSVAAPTASLHFTNDVVLSLVKKEINITHITLHVGAGTFKPVKTESIANHEMHGEHFYVTKESLNSFQKADQIIASGTTTLRTLESLYWLGVKLSKGNINNILQLEQWECYENMDEKMTFRESIAVLVQYLESNKENGIQGKTSLIIVPGYKFRSAKALITNFHQPRSTLLLLVAAFIGENWRKVYTHALSNNYRFLSYGDSSLLWRDQ